MVEDDEIEEVLPPPPSVGETLRAAREAKGMSLAQVAERTRITLRHLALIEESDFAQLPGRTYAIGFSRQFARVVGLDEAKIAEQVREELALIDPYGAGLAPRTFEPGDPARVPSPALAWLSVLAALVLLVGGSVFVWRTYVSPGMSLPWLTAEEEAPPPEAQAAAATPVPGGQVVFTALDQIWVRFYEQDGAVLMEKEMLQGETYTVPANALAPRLITARPDALSITIGGRAVPKLAEEQDMLDLPIDAQALLDRPSAPLEASPASILPRSAPRTRPATTVAPAVPQEAPPAEPASSPSPTI